MLLHRTLSVLSLPATVILASLLPVPNSSSSLGPGSLGRVCVIPSTYATSGGVSNDSPAIQAAFAACSANATIIFSPGINYNVLTPIVQTNLSNVVIAVQGNLHLPKNITYVQNIVARTSTWFTFRGSNINYVGTKDVNNGWIYSYGQMWWDANPANGLVSCYLWPHTLDTEVFLVLHFKSFKPVAWNVNLQGSNIVVTDTIIDAYSSTGSFPFNTDGFDVGATNVTIKNSVIYNGDDAIAVGSGASNVLFQGATIGYQTHGMSIGSLGSNQASYASVSNIKFDEVTVINGVYAARFKSWQGGQGLAKNVTWSNIRVYNTTFPIFVTQSYSNQATSDGSTPRPNNSSVVMQDFTWTNFTGTINTFQPGDGSCASDPCWYNVGLPNLAHTEAVIIECNTDSSCQNFALRNIEVFPQSMTPPTAVCINCTAANNPHLGFAGVNGTFVPTA